MHKRLAVILLFVLSGLHADETGEDIVEDSINDVTFPDQAWHEPIDMTTSMPFTLPDNGLAEAFDGWQLFQNTPIQVVADRTIGMEFSNIQHDLFAAKLNNQLMHQGNTEGGHMPNKFNKINQDTMHMKSGLNPSKLQSPQKVIESSKVNDLKDNHTPDNLQLHNHTDMALIIEEPSMSTTLHATKSNAKSSDSNITKPVTNVRRKGKSVLSKTQRPSTDLQNHDHGENEGKTPIKQVVKSKSKLGRFQNILWTGDPFLNLYRDYISPHKYLIRISHKGQDQNTDSKLDNIDIVRDAANVNKAFTNRIIKGRTGTNRQSSTLSSPVSQFFGSARTISLFNPTETDINRLLLMPGVLKNVISNKKHKMSQVYSNSNAGRKGQHTDGHLIKPNLNITKIDAKGKSQTNEFIKVKKPTQHISLKHPNKETIQHTNAVQAKSIGTISKQSDLQILKPLKKQSPKQIVATKLGELRDFKPVSFNNLQKYPDLTSKDTISYNSLQSPVIRNINKHLFLSKPKYTFFSLPDITENSIGSRISVSKINHNVASKADNKRNNSKISVKGKSVISKNANIFKPHKNIWSISEYNSVLDRRQHGQRADGKRIPKPITSNKDWKIQATESSYVIVTPSKIQKKETSKPKVQVVEVGMKDTITLQSTLSKLQDKINQAWKKRKRIYVPEQREVTENVYKDSTIFGSKLVITNDSTILVDVPGLRRNRISKEKANQIMFSSHNIQKKKNNHSSFKIVSPTMKSKIGDMFQGRNGLRKSNFMPFMNVIDMDYTKRLNDIRESTYDIKRKNMRNLKYIPTKPLITTNVPSTTKTTNTTSTTVLQNSLIRNVILSRNGTIEIPGNNKTTINSIRGSPAFQIRRKFVPGIRGNNMLGQLSKSPSNFGKSFSSRQLNQMQNAMNVMRSRRPVNTKIGTVGLPRTLSNVSNLQRQQLSRIRPSNKGTNTIPIKTSRKVAITNSISTNTNSLSLRQLQQIQKAMSVIRSQRRPTMNSLKNQRTGLSKTKNEKGSKTPLISNVHRGNLPVSSSRRQNEFQRLNKDNRIRSGNVRFPQSRRQIVMSNSNL